MYPNYDLRNGTCTSLKDSLSIVLERDLSLFENLMALTFSALFSGTNLSCGCTTTSAFYFFLSFSSIFLYISAIYSMRISL
jgi:hypothetical protein